MGLRFKAYIQYCLLWPLVASCSTPQYEIVIRGSAAEDNCASLAQSMVDATFKETIMKPIQGTPLEKQIEIYSYGKLDDEVLGGKKRYGFLHAKIAIVDGKTLTVSTSNLDPISRHLNSEVGTTIENLPKNSQNAQKLNKYIEDLKNNSTLRGSTEWLEIRKHSKNKIMNTLQVFITKIIYTLNLVPII